MITLPFPPCRALLVSFWLLMNLVGGLSIGTFLTILISPRWFILGIGLFLILTLLGLLWKRTTLFAYRACNKLARGFSRFAHQWLNFIIYYIIFIAVGRIGSSLILAKPIEGKSMWVPFRPKAVADYGSPNGNIIEEISHQSWVSSFLFWALKSGNWWTWCLLPLFMLISILDVDEEKSSSPANIYTLF